MTYKGKVDWWVGLVFLGGLVLAPVEAISKHDYRLVAVPAATILILLIWAWPQEYRIADDAIHIRAGMTKRVIPWSEITSISVDDASGSYSWSGVVLSRERVIIQYAGKYFVIAPVDQERFFDEAASRCPQLSRRSTGLFTSLN